MNTNNIRKAYLDFFNSKKHLIVDSAPVVIKNDPTLMFTNAGMNQFKDIFLGNSEIKEKRIANSQKCLRVSGKHNDLEEVGVDTYHHTLFEMLGNWSFGDYFKEDAIAWAWELLTDVYQLEKDRLYVTVFEGDKTDGLGKDMDAYNFWKKYVSEDRILNGNKKDNFWEMGDTGPCGPCSEIHFDARTDEERKQTPGKDLVNADHPQVIEIWNLVFMEYQRKANGSLEKLPHQHVDTGMGFERLSMVIQNKKSTYDTDLFEDYFKFLHQKSGIEYKGTDSKQDIAQRVIADHIRAIVFTIADGQLPSNTGAGYVIRRILRRAVRYGYSFLKFDQPFLHELVDVVVDKMGEQFTEIVKQKSLVKNVIREEEMSFLKTLDKGIYLFNDFINKRQITQLPGDFAFELYDTYGFPIDLTELLARENNMTVDTKQFEILLEEQKTRSRAATGYKAGDWLEYNNGNADNFIGYETLNAQVKILKSREVEIKKEKVFEIVIDPCPFYAEGGGQVGDTGFLSNGSEKITVKNTKKENGEFILSTNKIPQDTSGLFEAQVDLEKRNRTTANHTATHLLHAALRQVLGTHVEQKGSLVNDKYLRFDFSHYSKIEEADLINIEKIVNKKIRENIETNISIVPIQLAKEEGAMALFGEKYGDNVRMVVLDKSYSVELCGGTHVKSTGQIGQFKIISEAAVASGIRRIEAITNEEAENLFIQTFGQINEVKQFLKTKDVVQAVLNTQEQIKKLQLEIEKLQNEQSKNIKENLKSKIQENGSGFKYLAVELNNISANQIKDLSFQLRGEVDNLIMFVTSVTDNKPSISLIIDESLVSKYNLNASNTIRELAKEIQGGGGGQAFYATAGGKNVEGIKSTHTKFYTFLETIK
jgi:alanyl-tRNA synthetase